MKGLKFFTKLLNLEDVLSNVDKDLKVKKLQAKLDKVEELLEDMVNSRCYTVCVCGSCYVKTILDEIKR